MRSGRSTHPHGKHSGARQVVSAPRPTGVLSSGQAMAGTVPTAKVGTAELVGQHPVLLPTGGPTFAVRPCSKNERAPGQGGAVTVPIGLLASTSEALRWSCAPAQDAWEGMTLMRRAPATTQLHVG